MKRYETLILAIPEITADESADLEKQFEQIIKKASGSVRSFERWGKYRLEYQIWHNEYGIYFLTRFEIADENSAQTISDIDTLFKVKLPSLIMRHITTALRQDQPLNYIKPESLEDIPAQDVDSLLKENKPSRYMQSGGPMHKESAREFVREDDATSEL